MKRFNKKNKQQKDAMKKLKIVLIAVCMLNLNLCMMEAVQARTSSFNVDSPSLARRVRNLGMGNVGVALIGTHESSPFYNPAGLNDLKKVKVDFLNVTGEVSKNSIDLIKDVVNLASDIEDANANNGDRFRVLDDFVSDNTGEFRYLRVVFDIVNFTKKNFAAGLLIDERLSLAVREPGIPEFHIRNTADIAAYVSGARAFFDGALQMGVTLKPTVRLALNESDEVIELSLIHI